MYRIVAGLFAGGSLLLGSTAILAQTSCAQVADTFNQRIGRSIDVQELNAILTQLNQSHNRRLPEKFVTKRMAQAEGWRPGESLWSTPALSGKSIGGDRFGNRERQLPSGQWREADLEYRGGHRGGKRIVFSSEGRRFVTVDHYQSFTEVPACR